MHVFCYSAGSPHRSLFIDGGFACSRIQSKHAEIGQHFDFCWGFICYYFCSWAYSAWSKVWAFDVVLRTAGTVSWHVSARLLRGNKCGLWKCLCADVCVYKKEDRGHRERLKGRVRVGWVQSSSIIKWGFGRRNEDDEKNSKARIKVKKRENTEGLTKLRMQTCLCESVYVCVYFYYLCCGGHKSVYGVTLCPAYFPKSL